MPCATDYLWKQKVIEIFQKVSLVMNNVKPFDSTNHFTFQEIWKKWKKSKEKMVLFFSVEFYESENNRNKLNNGKSSDNKQDGK